MSQPRSAATKALKSSTCGAPVAHYCTTMQDNALLIPSKVTHAIRASDCSRQSPLLVRNCHIGLLGADSQCWFDSQRYDLRSPPLPTAGGSRAISRNGHPSRCHSRSNLRQYRASGYPGHRLTVPSVPAVCHQQPPNAGTRSGY